MPSLWDNVTIPQAFIDKAGQIKAETIAAFNEWQDLRASTGNEITLNIYDARFMNGMGINQTVLINSSSPVTLFILGTTVNEWSALERTDTQTRALCIDETSNYWMIFDIKVTYTQGTWQTQQKVIRVGSLQFPMNLWDALLNNGLPSSAWVYELAEQVAPVHRAALYYPKIDLAIMTQPTNRWMDITSNVIRSGPDDINVRYFNTDNGELEFAVIAVRAPDYTCYNCDMLEFSDAHMRYLQGDQHRICLNCQESCDFAVCGDCGTWMWTEDAYRDDNDYTDYCENCWHPHAAHRGAEYIRNYGYKPDPQWHRLPDEKDNSRGRGLLYFGMELEMELLGDVYNTATWVYEDSGWGEGGNGFFYMKEDGSIYEGFEMVTHPFTFAWMKEQRVFDQMKYLDSLINKRSTNAGCHVHMSKAAFTPAHLWKFLRLHRDNPEFLGIIGGRGHTAGYGTFKDLDLLKSPASLKATARRKNWNDYVNRSCAVNLQNETTIEMRYPDGIKSMDDAWATLEFMHALYSFTDMVSVEDAKAGALSDPGYVLGWVQDNLGLYPHLNNRIEDKFPTPKSLKNRSI